MHMIGGGTSILAPCFKRDGGVPLAHQAACHECSPSINLQYQCVLANGNALLLPLKKTYDMSACWQIPLRQHISSPKTDWQSSYKEDYPHFSPYSKCIFSSSLLRVAAFQSRDKL